MPQPKAYEIYYKACAAVDNYNHYRQSSLIIEKKLGTKYWAMRINIFLVAICIVDICLAYKISTGTEYTQADFYIALSEEIIDDMYNQPNSARNKKSGYNTPNQ